MYTCTVIVFYFNSYQIIFLFHCSIVALTAKYNVFNYVDMCVRHDNRKEASLFSLPPLLRKNLENCHIP